MDSKHFIRDFIRDDRSSVGALTAIAICLVVVVVWYFSGGYRWP